VSFLQTSNNLLGTLLVLPTKRAVEPSMRRIVPLDNPVGRLFVDEIGNYMSTKVKH